MAGMRSIGRASRSAAGWLLVGALFYAPWDYGATGADEIRNLNWILGAMFLLWSVSGFRNADRGGKAEDRKQNADRGRRNADLQRRETEGGRGRFWSWSLLGLSALLLAIGWGMALNAHAIADADYDVFLPLTSPVPKAPGSVDYALSVAFMWRTTALLGCVWVVADLVQDERWLLRVCWAIGLAGGSIALLGLIQKATGAEMVLWQPLDPNEPPIATFFATYYYHGNAGAYLNLALPSILGLAYRYTTRPSNPAARALWIALSLIMAVGVVSDTSRMGQAIAISIVLALLFVAPRHIARRARYLEPKTVLIALLVGSVAVWAVTQSSHLDRSWQRWERVESSLSQDARWRVDKVALDALPQAGALGFGPGTFTVVFPYLRDAPVEYGRWLFLHNDYLQTLLEWGFIGGLFWAGVFFGGMIAGVLRLTNKRIVAGWFPRQRLLLLLSVIALAGVALHAVVDFPLQIASIQLYAATYLGICWGSGGWGRKAESRGRRTEVGDQMSEDGGKEEGD